MNMEHITIRKAELPRRAIARDRPQNGLEVVGMVMVSPHLSRAVWGAPPRPFANVNETHYLPHSIGHREVANPPLSLSPFSSTSAPAARCHAARHGLLSEILWGLPKGQPCMAKAGSSGGSGGWGSAAPSRWPPLPLPRFASPAMGHGPWEPPEVLCLPGDQGWGVVSSRVGSCQAWECESRIVARAH